MELLRQPWFAILLIGGGGLGLIALVAALWLARRLRQLAREIDGTRLTLLERLEAAQQRRQESIQLDLFVRVVESAEAGTRALLTFSQLMAEHATSIVFDEKGSGFRQSSEQLTTERNQAEQAGLFLPPELDRPFQRALKAVIAVQVAAEAAAKLPHREERKDLCRPAVMTMDQEVLTFLNTSRIWKKRNWFLATTGEEAAPEAYSDATSPSLIRPRSLLRDGEALPR